MMRQIRVWIVIASLIVALLAPMVVSASAPTQIDDISIAKLELSAEPIQFDISATNLPATDPSFWECDVEFINRGIHTGIRITCWLLI